MDKSIYSQNGANFGWGPGVASPNPDKKELLRKFAIDNTLDIACGSGVYTKSLHDMGHQVQGVDLHPDFVQSARKKYKEIKFSVASAEKLPFEKDNFRTTILFDILEHTDDKKVLSEALRVSSRAIISVPHQNQKMLLKYGLSHAHYLDRTHRRVYTEKSLAKLFKDMKLRVIYLEPSLPISVSGLLVDRLSAGVWWKKIILKIILKPFLPEPEIYSTLFAVVER